MKGYHWVFEFGNGPHWVGFYEPIDAEAPERYSEPQKAEQPPGDNPGAAPDEAS